MSRLKQVAALPVRHDANGGWQILLVTSRETRRWVIPKGWPWPGLADHEAAANEAYEEAGVVGVSRPDVIGSYSYGKRRRNAGVVDVDVAVYLLVVAEEKPSWPEAHERERAWFSIPDAAAAVTEEELKGIIRDMGSEPGSRGEALPQ
jgi:8-oxo-dGTP pyrophosphatase MutT (NUDIX family)